PAATTRLWTRRMFRWQLETILLLLAEGTIGLWASVKTNGPPGPVIAVLGGVVFAVALVARRLLRSGRVRLRPVGAAAAALLLGACGAASGTTTGHSVDVVATTTQIADWVRSVGGSAVTVHQILQPNTDPHDYEPRPRDVEAAAAARVVFENGDGLDAWMG